MENHNSIPVPFTHPSGATKTLPENYTYYHALELSSWKVTIATNVFGIALLFIFGWMFMGIAAAINPAFFMLELTLFARLLSIQAFIITTGLVVIFHEICHGIFFWIFTRERPIIGFNLLYAYASAPGWHFPRNQFILIGIAPFVIITLLGIGGIFFANLLMVPRLILAMTVNAAGSIGDLLVIAWLISQPAKTLVQDDGPKITLYHP
ncbi:MAG: DUF3267 domain-containing protein [Chloroflexi bacterium]|nr:DUF3267 domain-containing protein [Chloroflexota bacterium]